MNKNHLISNTEIFGNVFNHWRLLRVCKLEQIFGVDWFAGKRILELGCGYGNIGIYFQDLGADVTFTDGRQEFLDVVKKKCPTAKTILLDQNNTWDLQQQFDLVIHFGISYHLENWQQDLACALKHGKYIAYETAVNRYAYDIEFEIKNSDYGEKHCGIIGNQGSLPSISLIEKNLIGDVKRYDDADLNAGNMKYTLNCNDNTKTEIKSVPSWFDIFVYGGRKFWLIKTSK